MIFIGGGLAQWYNVRYAGVKGRAFESPFNLQQIFPLKKHM